MKNNYRLSLTFLVFLAFSGFVAAQTSLGSSKSFMNTLKKELTNSAASKSTDKTILLQAEKTSFNGKINFKESNASSEFLIGEIKNIAESSFYIKVKDKSLEGHILLKKTKEAYKYFSDAQGNAFVEKVDINTLVCIDYKNLPTKENTTSKTAAAAEIAPGGAEYNCPERPQLYAESLFSTGPVDRSWPVTSVDRRARLPAPRAAC